VQEFKYEQLIQQIQEELSSGAWPPGSRIPSERDLAARYGVSRITAQKAVDEMIRGEHLIRYPGKRGTFVHPAGEDQSPQNAALIGVAIDDVTDRFGSTLLRGIEDYLWKRRMHTIICNGDRDFRKVEDYFTSLLEHNIDGVIFSPVIDAEDSEEKNKRIIRLLEERSVPYVLIDRYVPGVDSNFVSSSHLESTAELTTALLEQGHRKILLLKGLSCSSMEDREEGYRNAITRFGDPRIKPWVIQLNDNLLFRSMDSRELEKLGEIPDLEEFTGVIALNNRLLKGFVTFMNSRHSGWRRKITIGLHDALSLEIPGREEIYQVIQPEYDMGKEAARLLAQVLEEKSSLKRRVILQSRLVPGTTGRRDSALQPS